MPLPSTAPASTSPAAWDARVDFLLENKKIHPAAVPTLNIWLPLATLNNIHMQVAQLQHVLRALNLCGKEAKLSKHDLAEAFQILAVDPGQWPCQAIKIFNSSYFICLKMCYGDRQAAHRFSQFHETLIWKMTASTCNIPRRNIFMVIDD